MGAVEARQQSANSEDVNNAQYRSASTTINKPQHTSKWLISNENVSSGMKGCVKNCQNHIEAAACRSPGSTASAAVPPPPENNPEPNLNGCLTPAGWQPLPWEARVGHSIACRCA